MMSFDRIVRKHKLTGFTLWKTDKGAWQASFRNHDGSWRISIADTPSEAIEAALETYEEGGAPSTFDDGFSKKLAEKDERPVRRKKRDTDLL